MNLCDKCEAGPEGMQGHGGLRLMDPRALRSSERFVLACAECGAMWSRIFGRDGIEWVRADASAF